MDKLKSPIWLILSSVFPYLLLIIFFHETYDVIESLLTEDQKAYWFNYGVYFGVIAFLVSSFSVGLIIKKQPVGLKASWSLLLLSILNLTLFFAFIDEILPSNIPNWMFTSSDLSIYPYTFIIPSTLYSLILLVLHYTPQPKSNNAYINLIPILFVPAIVAGVLFVLGSFGTSSTDLWILKYLPTYILVFFTCVLVSFIIRFVYILSVKGKKRDVLSLVMKVLFSIAFPVAGLIFNSGIQGFGFGLFGDFNHPVYYILAVLNGIAICLPNPNNIGWRWALFMARSILFSFILYFTAVFLPYLPLSIFAILAVGFGFLMLAPLVVFVLQITTIRKDIEFLALNVPKIAVLGVLILCLMVLPTALTIQYKLDRQQLDQVFDFLYERNFEYDSFEEIDAKRLTRLLEHIDESKDRNASHTPFLDSYYNWIVLDNLMLSNKKIDDISSVFIGGEFEETRRWRNWWGLPTRNASLDSVEVESSFNGEYWTSYVHLSVSTTWNAQTEFRTYIEVPTDCNVSNYYLDIEGKREYGILAEKRTANWVYNNIVKTRKDPGILNEIADNRYMLKVFPVDSSTPRTTGIEFIHKEPISITIGDKHVFLGTAEEHNTADATSPYEIMDGQALFVSSQAKKSLEPTSRTPEYHLIVDRSSTSTWDPNSLNKVVQNLTDSIGSDGSIRYWAGNYNFQELDQTNWNEEALSVEKTGGFYPEFLMKRELKNNWESHSSASPIFIMLVSNITQVSVLKGFSNFMFTTPDIKSFFIVDSLGAVRKVDLESGENISESGVDEIKPDPVFRINWKGKDWFMSTNNDSEILFDSLTKPANNKWETALLLESQTRQLALYPNKENGWLNAVKTSLSSGILSPYTSYISLENEAQKKALLHKQKEVLNSNENLDLEEAEQMSEPSIIWYLIFALLLWLWKGRKTSLPKALKP
ncbi:MAG: MSEP-CTERM sorting domain-containing protein [Flavobacteriales bacterium]|nr:MSEP-CTERM sorting domain-containing protein [Flavobacteriales bacterium]